MENEWKQNRNETTYIRKNFENLSTNEWATAQRNPTKWSVHHELVYYDDDDDDDVDKRIIESETE